MLESRSRSALVYACVEKVSERDHQIVKNMFRIWLPCSAVLRWRRALVDQKDQKDPNGFRLLRRRQASTHIQKLSDIYSIPMHSIFHSSLSLAMVLGWTPLVRQFLQRLASRLSFWWPELEKGAHLEPANRKKWKALNAPRAKHFRVCAVLFFCLEAWDILLTKICQEQAKFKKVDWKADLSQRFIKIQH